MRRLLPLRVVWSASAQADEEERRLARKLQEWGPDPVGALRRSEEVFRQLLADAEALRARGWHEAATGLEDAATMCARDAVALVDRIATGGGLV